jgi:repressor LexA
MFTCKVSLARMHTEAEFVRGVLLVEGLNQRGREILRFLASRASRGQNPPSMREIGATIGLRSSRSAYVHLGKLEKERYVERSGTGARTARLTEKGWQAVLDEDTPLLGRIAAGRGLEAVVTGDEAYSLAAELLLPSSGRRRYLLRVVGQSMIGARIEDGDLLVVEEDEDPPEGAIVVALLRDGEEVTVKRLYREGEMIRLKPQNGEHEDLLIPAREVRLQGRVVHVIHPPRR